MIAAHHGRAVASLPEIARRRHDHQPGIDRALHRRAQRIVAIRLEHGMPERQVDDANPILARWSMAQSIALMTSLVSPEPSAPSTRRLTMWAPGAMPA